jgi:hypothetical protein
MDYQCNNAKSSTTGEVANRIASCRLSNASPTKDVSVIRFYWESANYLKSAALYETLLGVTRLAEFVDHDGFSGVVLGLRDCAWQLEIVSVNSPTTKRECNEGRRGIVLYVDAADFRCVSGQIELSGARVVVNDNPYWIRRGAITLTGHDGESIIVVQEPWDDALE